jgi:hypothetical protein
LRNILFYGSFPALDYFAHSQNDFYCHSLISADQNYWKIDNHVLEAYGNWNDLDLSKYFEILDAVRAITPTLSRHFDDLPSLDLHMRNITFQIYSLADAFKTFKIELFVHSTSSPHWLESWVCDIACRLNGIPQLYLYATVFNGNLIPIIQRGDSSTKSVLVGNYSTFNPENIIRNFRVNSNASVNIAGDRFITDFTNAIFSLLKSKLKVLIRKYGLSLRNFLSRPLFDYAQLSKIKEYGLATEINLLRTHYNSIKRLRQMIAQDKIQYNSILSEAQNKNCSLPVIFAHFQPEATTFPEAGAIWNHIDQIIEIRNKGYLGTILYKEHPAMFKLAGRYSTRGGTSRSVEYYEQLRFLGCIFISTDQILNENFLPITMTGTIALESSLNGLISVMSGSPWFSGLPGTEQNFSKISELCLRLNKRSIAVEDSAFNFLDKLMAGNVMPNVLGVSGYAPRTKEVDLIEFWTAMKLILDEVLIQDLNRET